MKKWQKVEQKTPNKQIQRQSVFSYKENTTKKMFLKKSNYMYMTCPSGMKIRLVNKNEINSNDQKL